MKRLAKTLVAFLLLSLLTASELGARGWTVLVYMAADNDLSFQSEVDLKEMEAVGSTPDVAVVVQQDIPGAGGRRYLIQRGARALLDSLGPIDMADPAVLTQFGTWGASRFPAERYALILWDHGNGWSVNGPRKDSLKVLSFGSDWSSGDVMGIADGGLRTALEGIQKGLGRPLDVLAFDGCMLQEAEVASEVSTAAKVMVGSQELVPANGYPYDHFLDSLVSNPTADENTVAKELVNCYISFYQDSGLAVSNSALLLTRTQELAAASKSLAQAYLNASADSGIAKARDSALAIFAGGGEVDLGDFLRLAELFSQGDIRGKARAFQDALSSSMLISRSLGADSIRHSGLSAWFPKTCPEFASRALDYSGLQWVPESDWDEMVYESYRSPGSVRPTAPTLSQVLISKQNSYALSWGASYAPARINAYEVNELNGRTVVLEDGAEDSSSHWALDGFVPSEGDAHSGRRSYYAFRDSAWMTVRNSIQVDQAAWLSLWAKRPDGQKVVAEISPDSSFASATPLDSLTLGAASWAPAGFSLPKGNYYLRLQVPKAGVYFDDLSLEMYASSFSTLISGQDTAYAVKNKPKGRYYYRVRAQDREGIWGLFGPLVQVDLQNFAPAYVYPNPFRIDVHFVVDGNGSEAKVRIYTVAGDLVRTLEVFTGQTDGTQACVWDGKNESGKEAAAGIYIFLISASGRIHRGTVVRIK